MAGTHHLVNHGEGKGTWRATKDESNREAKKVNVRELRRGEGNGEVLENRKKKVDVRILCKGKDLESG